MGDTRSLDLTEALRRLEAFEGQRVTVTTNLHGRFFGCAVRGRLKRVETLAPDHAAISFALEHGQGFFIDLGEAEISTDEEGGGWLEFRVGSDLCLLIESCAQAPIALAATPGGL